MRPTTPTTLTAAPELGAAVAGAGAGVVAVAAGEVVGDAVGEEAAEVVGRAGGKSKRPFCSLAVGS